jgi:hydrogenase expression/formation protein HypE
MVFNMLGIKAVLFDFDGTLTEPGALNLSEFKKSIDCPPEMPVLEFIESISDRKRRNSHRSALEAFENEGAKHSVPNEGAEELLAYLRDHGVPMAIISRNSFSSIKRALENFRNTTISDFDPIITRDDPIKPKPSGEGILFAARKLNLSVDHVAVVGDYVFDIQAGQEAGATTFLLDSGKVSDPAAVECDFVVKSLRELIGIFRMDLPLAAGKFPNDLLEDFFSRLDFDDPSVLIYPGVGEDTAAVLADPEDVLILKSDPITFATDAIGHYAVLVNANDIATSGALPRWLLTTLFFPCGTTPSYVFRVLNELQTACRQWGITLCGGHTEITDAVNRPVVSGMLVGTVNRGKLVRKEQMKSGDKVLFTKAVAVEGTAIIAREFESRLKDLGISQEDIAHCKGFLSRISILKEAKIAGNFGGVSAMHDVTEGGAAAAIQELSVAGKHRIRIHMDRIPIFPQTADICKKLDIHPLGLIGSGSLLICCRTEDCDILMDKIRTAGVDVTCIGDVLEAGRGVEAVKKDTIVEWPHFEVDEITQLF